jgi:hypothetical protein
VSTAQPCLSDAAVFTSRLERLLELAKQLRQCSPVHQAKSHGSLQAAVEKQIKAGSASWLRTYYSGVQELSTAVPQNSSVILVDEDQWAAGDTIAGRRRIHFPARNGSYWGPPATGASAVEELAQLRNAGVEYIVFAWPAFWWLDHYEMLSDYLSSHCRQILSTPRIRVFHLGPDSEQ